MSDVQKSIVNPPPGFTTKLNKVADVKSTYFRVESEGRVGKERDIIKKRIVDVFRRNPSSATPPRGTTPTTPALTLVYFKVE
jgi:hypothetical protein